MSDRFPWFPFYVADWRTSNTVRAMTYEQRGVFLELLAIAWDDGIKQPSLPADAVELAQITGLGRRWGKVGAPIVAKCFTAEDGRLYNERLTKVWEVQRAKYAIRSEAGRLGGIARANRLANGKHSQDSASGFGRQTQKSDRTNSSSGATRVGVEVNDALASLVKSAKGAP